MKFNLFNKKIFLFSFIILISHLTNAQSITWNKKTDVAQYGGANWSNRILKKSNLTLDEAKIIAVQNNDIEYFFYMKEGYMYLSGIEESFKKGDAVFFSGKPWLGSAKGKADTYIKEKELSFDNDEDYNLKGEKLYAIKSYENAIKYFKMAVIINPNDAKAYSNLGLTYFKLNQYQLAMEANQKAIKNSKNTTITANTYYNMAIIYQKQNQYDLAIYYYNLAYQNNNKPIYLEKIESIKQLNTNY